MPFHIACCTHHGTTPGQQDSVLFGTVVHQDADLEVQTRADGDSVLVAIADGLSISARSAAVSRALLERLPIAVPHGATLSSRHLREVQRLLCERAERHPRIRGGASTIVAAQVTAGLITALNCGDSRAYLRSADGDVRQLSRDHTELQRLIETGAASKDIEYASVYDVLTDCITADPDESDFAIHRGEARLAPGDLLVLCSDGVHDVLAKADWHTMLGTATDPAALVSATRAAVLAAGAPDNFSVIAVSISGVLA